MRPSRSYDEAAYHASNEYFTRAMLIFFVPVGGLLTFNGERAFEYLTQAATLGLPSPSFADSHSKPQVSDVWALQNRSQNDVMLSALFGRYTAFFAQQIRPSMTCFLDDPPLGRLIH